MADRTTRYLIGADVGSTTVKAVVVRTDDDAIVWQAYERHETRQPEKLLELMCRMEAEAGVAPANARVFITGSGGQVLAARLGAKFVQEVTAVSLAVEKLYPEVHSVIELGGQDAKIIVFQPQRDGRKKKIPSMNDRCAGGTGAVIDKIAAKLRLPPDALGRQRYRGIRVHPVAGKCGVFAETDINSLQKQGIPADELMASLFDALVLQNLTVLARGHTLRPHVLLLGGPNTFIPGLREAWQHNIPLVWQERGVQLPAGTRPEDLISVPDNAVYFAALGAVEFGRTELDESVGCYQGTADLDQYIRVDRLQEKARSGSRGLHRSSEELAEFSRQFTLLPFVPATFEAGQTVRAFVGIDGGSTSTKGVLLSERAEVLCKAYQLSQGNPIQDTIEIFERLRVQVESYGAHLDVLGVATTGYAKDILRDVLGADVALVETVAHTESAKQAFDDPHVILDVGGQDIKLIFLHDGVVRDFRLNTQCSAGNGYFLQSTAEDFGLTVDEYAGVAFTAEVMPVFGYGCAVFLQSDIVNFQRQGWQAPEILAGLAAVLPKNIFLYVAGVPNLARLGRRFVLQGGTQHNLAAVKAEVDFIRGSFRDSGLEPEILLHPHCGESGAIGAALEARRLWQQGRSTTFVGLDAVRRITYRTTRGEETRCRFCKNTCLRTFIDVDLGATAPATLGDAPRPEASPSISRRLIIATCEKGTVEAVAAMREIRAGLEAVKAASPNFADLSAREVWRPQHPARVADPMPSRVWSRRARSRRDRMQGRERVRIGIPRALNMYMYAPLFSAYLESLGVPPDNLIYSDFTSTEMYRVGSSRGAIDPCFPSKIALAHIHNLIYAKHRKWPLDCLFFPMVDVLDSPLVNPSAHNACPTVASTPKTVLAAYTKETDVFAEHGLCYLHPMVNLADRRLFARQMFDAWDPLLGLSPEENNRAVTAGFAALDECWTSIRRRAREALDRMEREDRLGIVMLGRPYHHDPGINHEILDQFQKLGYSVFSQNSLPMDTDLLDRLFGDEVRAGVIGHPLDISDVWKNAFSASTNQKLWAAKFAARHPNLVALEFSSFKCGHDAPVYTVIEKIIECSGTPYFAFKDIDENRPTGSIRIRVETIDYFLRRYREELARRKQTGLVIERQLEQYERRLRDELRRAELEAIFPGSRSSPQIASVTGRPARAWPMTEVSG